MIRIITCSDLSKQNAGPKAKEDIAHILKKKYGKKITVKSVNEKHTSSIVTKVLNAFRKILAIMLSSYLNDDTIIIQYPMSNRLNFLSLLPKKRTIVIIHDLQGLRTKNRNREFKEIKQLKRFTYVIAHNARMKEYLVKNGLKGKNIYTIDIFDYLCSGNKHNQAKNRSDVAFVGNLSEEKAPFIHQLKPNKIKYKIHLYGVGIRNDINEKEKYEGAFNPNELPSIIGQKYGLVWDGRYDESDENSPYKRYTKFNNPHKLSCYIACGIPVIVWEKSAIASFVRENNIGYTITNLYDINNLNEADYDEKRNNVLKIRRKLINGYYTNKVFDEIFDNISKIKDKRW